MGIRTRTRFIALGLILLLVSAGAVVVIVLRQTSNSSCPPFLSGSVVRSEVASHTFGGVTTFALPAPQRLPNAILVSSDSSVWFAGQAVPALAHLYVTNGTLVEYILPGRYPVNSALGYTCDDKTDIWGIAAWNGRIWASDTAQNRLVGLSAGNDSFTVISLAKNDSSPYTLTPGPDDELWFTQLGSGQIGTLFTNGTVREHDVTVAEHLNQTGTTVQVQGVPAQIAFVNDSLAYYVDASPLISGSPLFKFDPSHFSPIPIGGNVTLADPDSIAIGEEGVWLAEHSDSSVALYSPATSAWEIYPTSTVSYIGTTLPYFVVVNGSEVWFNEHYANKIAVIHSTDRSLTEYSVSDPSAKNMSQLSNALTMALGGGRAWFTEDTSNAVGFVNASYRPTFSVIANESNIVLRPGQNASFGFTVSGNSSEALATSFSSNGPAKDIALEANQDSIQSLGGTRSFSATVQVSSSTPLGRYSLLVTESDGLVWRSVYVELVVD